LAPNCHLHIIRRWRVFVSVAIHPSCFPDRTPRRLSRIVSYAPHESSLYYEERKKQAQQWLALHEVYSRLRETDEDCLRTYDRAFAETAELIEGERVTVISIGCGGGQKDFALLKALRSQHIRYILPM